ncbi:MAG: SulP family inorganic anion transporter [Acidimicrobiales bacterium]
MGHGTKHSPERVKVGQRVESRGLRHMLAGLTRENLTGEVLAGVTLLAIAIPEQLATSQLAGVPAFTALIAFIVGGAAFLVLGSNPIMSVGADSTIAPLFAVALLRLAAPSSAPYLSLLAATALVTGVLVAAVGLLRLGWLADFLSLPIIGGFMAGIGVIIVVHQLPRVLGVPSGGESVAARLRWLAHHLGHVSAWSIALALGTLAVMVVGERVNARWPTALVAVIGATLLSVGLSLARHGVVLLGSVSVGWPTWRLHTLTLHAWGVVVTTSLTLVVVIISQSAATARSSADEIGAADDLDRDFVGVGAANVVAGLAGAFPVNASPARTTVVGVAGGRTKMVGLVAVVGALVLSPLATYARDIPLSVLAGVLIFVASRLVKIRQLRVILRTSGVEFVLAVVSCLGVVILGVELGLAIAVGLAILNRTWRSSRPRMLQLGRRAGTTSWEPLDQKAVGPVDHVLAVLFDEPLYFANADVFRRQVHSFLQRMPDTRHVVIDAVAMADLDYTGLVTLAQVVSDLARDGVDVSVARANDAVEREITSFPDKALRRVHFHNSVDSAARHALDKGD